MFPAVKDSKYNPDCTEVNGIVFIDFTGTRISVDKAEMNTE